MTETQATCPACGGGRWRMIWRVQTTADFRIQRCKSCGLVAAMPRPTPEELTTFYNGPYFNNSSEFGLGYAEYATGEDNARKMWHRMSAEHDLNSLPARSVLDVGCATGGFVHAAAEDGWDARGVDPSADAVRIGRDRFGVSLETGDIFHRSLDGRRFALITMWHVLEHLIDPLAAVERARELLLPGGWLLIELPNWSSVGRRVRGQRWRQLRPPEHINFFNTRSLDRLAQRGGLVTRSARSHHVYGIRAYRDKRRSWPVRAAAALVQEAVERAGCGGYARLISEKPNEPKKPGDKA